MSWRCWRAALLLLAVSAGPVLAGALPCQPCAGIRLPSQPPSSGGGSEARPAPPAAPGQAAVAQPAPPPQLAALAELLRAAHLKPGSPLFVAWEVVLAESAAGEPGPASSSGANAAFMAAASAAADVAAAGGSPWLSLVFQTPAPLERGASRLQAELRAAAELAAAAPAGCIFQVVWRPEGHSGEPFDPAQYAFLVKRAAVALTGARSDARVASAPLPQNEATLHALFAEEVAAYLDVIALAPVETASEPAVGAAPAAASPAAASSPAAGSTASTPAAAVALLAQLDPGRPVVLDSLAAPEAAQVPGPGGVLAEAARRTAQGYDLTIFQTPAPSPAALAPFIVLAREFAGDLSYSPDEAPEGASAAWAFVRGKDLAVRVIAETPPESLGGELVLRFHDTELRRPVRFPYLPGRVAPPAGQLTGRGLEIHLADPGPVVVLGLERPAAGERQGGRSGISERVEVATEREIPVEEILRRLQAFEDAQSRRLDRYLAVNTTHLRFQPSQGSASVDATLEGAFFWSREGGADWAWETLYVNGVKWRGKQLPEIPLIQPEKAAALPLEIHFNKQYRYRLRGTERLDGRDAWVVDFAPVDPGAGGRLYQGSVWIDRELSARLRTRAVQVGLQGEIISNEETLFYSPVDADGKPAPWGGTSFVLPLRLRAQQILSVLNETTVIDRETILSQVRLNPADFDERRKAVASSDVTMVRDTDHGLRFLVKDKSGERVVKEGYSKSKLFAVAGLFVDDSLDYPLPLGGVNYFSFDFRGTGDQINIFFAGPLLTANLAEPRLFGSRFDLGGEAFALAVPFTDNYYINGKQQTDQELKVQPATVGLRLGRPLGEFVKASFAYSLFSSVYSHSDKAAPGFVLPDDNLLSSFDLGLSYARSGYRLSAGGSWNWRSRWSPWGLPGNPDYRPEDRRFTRWHANASKDWYLPYFQKIGLELDALSGSNLDRFSKYQFGFFGPARIHGYKSNAVRATEVEAAHLSYGFEVGNVFRLDALADAALATDKLTGLSHELLAGAGIAGTFIGPWSTLVTLDAGVPVAGPDHGFVLYLVFLKLFH